jgi:glycosyltransferase involved in cell wall biosynthesis
MKILFLIPYPLNEAPSQRFRFEQYINVLSSNGLTPHFQTFLDSHNWHFFFKSGKTIEKVKALGRGFARRFLILFRVSQFDFVFIHREAMPVGPPIIEWVISKVLCKRIIYDFDDAIWLTDRTNESWLLRILKWRTKVSSICTWSYKISCGNEYLAEYAKQFNKNVIVNPTTIDTENQHVPSIHREGKLEHITIGWTGSHSTLKYLYAIESIIKALEDDQKQLQFIIIADYPPSLSVPSAVFVPWSKKTEIVDLAKIDIGIMPLPDDEWSKGKCGFKALQYMAMEIPTIASPVGVNAKIIDHGVDGFLCSTSEEWISTLKELIKDFELRKRIGKNGRKKIIKYYSVISNSPTFLSLFE